MTTLYRSLGATSALRRQVTATLGRSCGTTTTTTTTTHTAATTRRTYATTVAVHEKAADDAVKLKPLGTPYANLTIGIPKETFPLERRVAATPESVARLVKPGFSVVLETDAGLASNYANADYEAAGATMVPNVWEAADIVIKVRVFTHAVRRIAVCLSWWVIGTKERKNERLTPVCV
jgi:NAD(P) transhydrogenase